MPSALRGTFGVGYDGHCAAAGAATAASPISQQGRLETNRHLCSLRVRIEAEKIPYSGPALKPTRLTLRIVAMGA